jgi:hypothetical protein
LKRLLKERLMPDRHLVASLLAFAASLPLAVPAYAADSNFVSVPMDEVRILNFAKPVKTVYVGNPTIADVTVIDATHVFLLGKNFGSTNLLAIDSAGHQVVEEHITVLGHQGSVVTLQRGPARVTLNCAAQRCEAMPTPGDETAPFDSVIGQVDKRQDQNLKAAAATTPQR